MLVAPRKSECFGLPWSALVCYSLPWMLLVWLLLTWRVLAWPPLQCRVQRGWKGMQGLQPPASPCIPPAPPCILLHASPCIPTAQWRKPLNKEIEFWKKCPKVKPYCTPIFDLIMFKAFLDDAKLPKFCAKCFSLSKSQILGVFFGFVCEKTWRAGQIDLKLGMQKLWILFWKKLENNNFIPAALHCEFDIWNIRIFSKYFWWLTLVISSML